MTRSATMALPSPQSWYRQVWRWHFYAGVITLPFIILLSLTGMVYLFKPQIDAWQEKPYTRLELSSPAHSLDEQVMAARAALPQARLVSLELPPNINDAARVLMMSGQGDMLRVYVRPDSLAILATIAERDRISKMVRTLHGELFAGDAGAILVELAGAWAIVMLLTGLFLWWPRDGRGLAGTVYPRWGGGGRRFLRDLHAVTGFWIAILAMFFLLSALPWTKVWGGGLKQLQAAWGAANAQHDWTTGPSSEHEMHMQRFSEASPALGEGPAPPSDRLSFDQIAAQVRPLGLAEPILISMPTRKQPNWIVRSDAQNRPLRTTLEFNPRSGDLVRRRDFSAGTVLDRVVGIGVAAHEGQLFGWVNQVLGVVTALGLLTMSVSAALMWWRRRPGPGLGAPPAAQTPPKMAAWFGGLVLLLGLFLPMLGASLLLILLLERRVLRRTPALRVWLGLT